MPSMLGVNRGLRRHDAAIDLKENPSESNPRHRSLVAKLKR
jgi:hypothetical protein